MSMVVWEKSFLMESGFPLRTSSRFPLIHQLQSTVSPVLRRILRLRLVLEDGGWDHLGIRVSSEDLTHGMVTAVNNWVRASC